MHLASLTRFSSDSKGALISGKYTYHPALGRMFAMASILTISTQENVGDFVLRAKELTLMV